MSFLGGGFFGSGASSTTASSAASQTSQDASGGGAPVSVSNIETGKNGNVNLNLTSVSTPTDYGAISGAYNFASGAFSDAANLGYDGLDLATGFASRALSDTAAFAYDGVSLAADVMNNSANLAYDGLNVAGGLIGDALVQNGAMSLAVLGSSERFADNAALLSLEHSRMSANVASDAMNAVLKSNANSTALAYDSINKIEGAYSFANQGLLALTSDYGHNVATLTDRSISGLFNLNQDYMGVLGAVQSDALQQIGSSTQTAQNASLKALDYIYEASKTAEERVITESTKWLVGGVVAVAALFIFPSFAKVFK